jgi:hypothetical protein
LALLYCDGSVDAFYNRVMALSCCDPGITETHQVQLFMARLGQPLRTDVALHKPSTLNEAIMLAQAYEQHATPAPSSQPSSRVVSKPPCSTGTTVPTASVAAPASSSASINQPTVKKFTPVEIAECRIKGLCFKCDEKFLLRHRDSCKCLFCIELLDDEEDGTMHVSVLIGDTSLQELLDSGSTHNFIDTATADRAGISFTSGAGLRMAVANRDHLTRPG